MAETMAVPPRGLVWQAVDAIKAATITPESETGAPNPMTVRDIVRENKRLLAAAQFELEHERQQCMVESKNAELEGKRHLKANKRALAKLCAERARSAEQQIERIERAKSAIRQNGQTVNEFSATTTISQVMTSIARTMEIVNHGSASGAQLKIIAAQLRRQNKLMEVQRSAVDAAIDTGDSPASESADSILSDWEQSMVANAPRPPGSGGGGDAPRHRDDDSLALNDRI